MGTVNRSTILGLVGQQPELKLSKNGKPYVRLSLATHRRWRDESGSHRTDTQWLNVMLWGKLAETCASHCEKGAAVLIEGYLTSYSKKDEAGITSYHTGIVGEQLHLIPGTRPSRSAGEDRDGFAIRARHDQRSNASGEQPLYGTTDEHSTEEPSNNSLRYSPSSESREEAAHFPLN